MQPNQAQISDDFDRHSQDYDEQINGAIAFSGLTNEFFIRVKCVYLERLVARHLGDAREFDVLDLGCGVGKYHRHLSGKFRSLTGIDVSRRSVDIARQQGYDATYDVYDGGRLPYDDDRFHVAFTSCVMHHVPVAGWQEFTAEMKRVLRPGGLAVVFEHNPANPVTRRIVNNCPIDDDAVLLSPKTTAALFGDAGLEVVASRSILTIPPIVSPLYPVDEFLGRLRLGAQYYLVGKK